VIGILIYLWIPEKDPRKHKAAIARINETIRANSHRQVACQPQSETKDIPCQPTEPSHLPAASWRHDRTREIWARFVEPYRKVLEASGYLVRISTLLSILDQHGHCPSVVQVTGDREHEELGNVYGILSQVSLLDHSLNVAEKIVEGMVDRRVKDPEMLVGKLLVAALGHDIGKIPGLTDAAKYSKGDHAYVSYLVLKKAVLTDTFPQREEILKAVREHHYRVDEGLTGQLRRADHMAREMEAEQLASQGQEIGDLVAALASSHTVDQKPVSEPRKQGGQAPPLLNLDWLDLDEFLQFVEPHINVEDEGHFKAFSMNNGLVYLMLSLVSDTVVRLAQKHNHPEVLVGCETKEKKRSIEYTVKTMLAQRGFIPSFIGDGYSGARFALYDKNGKKLTAGIYMPVSAEAFKTPLSELEAKKNNCPFIKQIADVQPKTGSRSGEKNG